jgi:hypothetical protein
VGELEATQFSTTTKLRGQATYVVGASGYTGSDNYGLWSVPMARQMNGATTFNYDLRLILDTSFTGKDLLRTTLRSGNFQNSVFGNNYLPIDTLESAFQQPTRANEVAINRFFYSLPLGHDLQVTVGPKLRIDDPGMLGLWPSAYNKGEILNLFSYAGAPAAYNFNALGGGAGFSLGRLLGNPNLRVSSSYVVVNAAQGSPAPGGTLTPGPLSTAYADAGGIGTAASSSSWTSQLSMTGKAFYGHWGAAVAYAYTRNLAMPNGTPRAVEISGPDSSYPPNSTSNLGLSGYWSPADSGWIPSVSVGWGYSIVERAPYQPVTRPRVQSWMVGLQWENIWGGGDGFGSAIGQAPFVTSSGVGSPKGFPVAQVANDSNLTWEAWYRWQVTDHIAITPAIYYAWQVGGEVGRLSPAGLGTNINNLGGLIKTTFKF